MRTTIFTHSPDGTGYFNAAITALLSSFFRKLQLVYRKVFCIFSANAVTVFAVSRHTMLSFFT